MVVSGGFGVGLFWGVGMDPEKEILTVVGAPNEILLIYGLLSSIGLLLTLAKSFEHLRLFGLVAWTCGVLSGWSAGVGETKFGVVLMLMALMFVTLGFTWYEGSAKTW